MSFELIAGALALIFGAFGWWRIEKHGAAKGDKKRAEEDRDAAKKRVEQGRRPDLTPDQHDDFIDRL